MADLKSLIRVRKHTVEQKQKALSELYRQSENLKSEKQILMEKLAEEQTHLLEMDVSMLSYFGPYSDAVHQRVEKIEEEAKKLETRIENAREDIRRAYAEQKKIEITQARREDEERTAQDKKESDELDAIAIEGFRRKLEEQD